MRKRLPLVLSTTALIVAVLGSTSFGRAAIATAVPLAKVAYLADTARDAIRVDDIKASRTPTPGMLLPLDSTGKLPASIGAVGPQGPKGDKGDTGSPGLSGYEVDTQVVNVGGVGGLNQAVSCPSGKKVLGGGLSSSPQRTTVVESFPVGSSAWEVTADTSAATTATVYAVCATIR